MAQYYPAPVPALSEDERTEFAVHREVLARLGVDGFSEHSDGSYFGYTPDQLAQFAVDRQGVDTNARDQLKSHLVWLLNHYGTPGSLIISSLVPLDNATVWRRLNGLFALDVLGVKARYASTIRTYQQAIVDKMRVLQDKITHQGLDEATTVS
ncbi:hypothetical protein JCM1840_007680 [Sporobolomyces johnsonii]